MRHPAKYAGTGHHKLPPRGTCNNDCRAEKLIGDRKQIHVCEIGCGGGDNLVALQRWCKKKGIQAHFTGIDIKAACIEVAKEKKELQRFANWMISDYQQVQFTQLPDIIFSSYFATILPTSSW